MNLTDEISPSFPQNQTDELWREGLRQGRRVIFRVASASMVPTLKMGDRVIVERLPNGRAPKIGDIVMLSLDDGWMVHRIVGKKRSGGLILYRQKGDSGGHAGLVSETLIAGMVIGIIRSDGTIIDLGKPHRKAVNVLLGSFYRIIDWLRRAGHEPADGTGRHQTAVPVADRSCTRFYAGRLLCAVETRISGIAARLTRGSDSAKKR